MNAARATISVLTLTLVPALCSAQTAAALSELNRARSLLNRGRADSALAGYRQALIWAQADTGNSPVLAEAHFGIATAKGSITEISAEQSRIEDYLEAAELDSVRFFVAATNNAAQVARLLGDHDQSARLFRSAASDPHPARSYILLDAGREWERAGQPDSALVAFEQAVREDPSNAAAVDGLAALALGRHNAARVLLLPELTEHADPAGQQIVALALIELMADPTIGVAEFDSALTLLAGVLIRLAAGPASFTGDTRPSLEEAARLAGHDGLQNLVDAYSSAPEGSYPPGWWGADLERSRIWARSMTALGTWHTQRGDQLTARRYFECALGYPSVAIVEPWVDVEALVPLARTYLDLPDGYDDFAYWAFAEKALAYDLLRYDAPRAVPLARRLHLTLGMLFARRGQWGGSIEDIFGAAYHLSQMREFTQRMQADGTTVTDPPELLEELVYAYWAIGWLQEARDLVPEVLRAYSDRHRMRDFERFESVAANDSLLGDVVRQRRQPGL